MQTMAIYTAFSLMPRLIVQPGQDPSIANKKTKKEPPMRLPSIILLLALCFILTLDIPPAVRCIKTESELPNAHADFSYTYGTNDDICGHAIRGIHPAPIAKDLINAKLLSLPQDIWKYQGRGLAVFGRGLHETQEDVLYLNGNGFADEAYTIPADTLQGLSGRQKELLFSVMEAIIQEDEPYKYSKEDAAAVEKSLESTWYPYYGEIKSVQNEDGTYSANPLLTSVLAKKNILIRKIVRNETKKLSLQNASEKEKISKLCDAVCNYYTFNKRYAGLSCGDYIESLISKQGACQDYAQLFYMMCKEENIQCKIIFGESVQGYHAWCYAKMEEEWKYLDPTWSDAGGIYPPASELWDDHWDPKAVSIRNMY